MKKVFISALIASMLLCGCGTNTAETSSANDTASDVSSAVSEEASSAAQASSEEPAGKKAASSQSENDPASSDEQSEKEDEPSEAQSEKEAASSEAQSEAEASEEEASSQEASSDEDTEADEDVYAGTYVEEAAGRGVIEITKGEGFTYNVHITWPDGAAEVGEWDLSGEFSGRAVLRYDNCKKTVITYSEDGSASSEIAYTDGTGYLQMRERDGDSTGLFWSDDVENVAADAFFVKQ